MKRSIYLVKLFNMSKELSIEILKLHTNAHTACSRLKLKKKAKEHQFFQTTKKLNALK